MNRKICYFSWVFSFLVGSSFSGISSVGHEGVLLPGSTLSEDSKSNGKELLPKINDSMGGQIIDGLAIDAALPKAGDATGQAVPSESKLVAVVACSKLHKLFNCEELLRI
jgi:hypothetical protein